MPNDVVSAYVQRLGADAGKVELVRDYVACCADVFGRCGDDDVLSYLDRAFEFVGRVGTARGRGLDMPGLLGSGGFCGRNCGAVVEHGLISGCDSAVGAGSGSDSGSAGHGTVGGEAVREKSTTLANRAKRRRKRDAKSRKKAEAESGRVCDADTSSTPEWRRKSGEKGFHVGVFAGCSEAKQLSLRESRADRLVAENNLVALRAKHDGLALAARIKSRLVEEEIEQRRLTVASSNAKMISEMEKSWPRGYAETIGVESLGSVSPDSSISVAELRRRDEALRAALERVQHLEDVIEKKLFGPAVGPLVAEPVRVEENDFDLYGEEYNSLGY